MSRTAIAAGTTTPLPTASIDAESNKQDLAK
jgi:hypothetical protein